MLSIAYVSAATSTLSDEDVTAILMQARINNVRHELTGALLYHRGRFIQILEGKESHVRERFAVIAADSRHRNVQLFSEKMIGDRQFPDWTMGFRPLSDDSVKELEGFDDYFDSRVGRSRLKHADNEAQQLLEWLAEYWFESH